MIKVLFYNLGEKNSLDSTLPWYQLPWSPERGHSHGESPLSVHLALKRCATSICKGKCNLLENLIKEGHSFLAHLEIAKQELNSSRVLSYLGNGCCFPGVTQLALFGLRWLAARAPFED